MTDIIREKINAIREASGWTLECVREQIASKGCEIPIGTLKSFVYNDQKINKWKISLWVALNKIEKDLIDIGIMVKEAE